MARKETVFEPNDPGLVSPTTEPTEGRGAVVDPDGGDPDPGPSPVVGTDGDGISLADPRPSPVIDFTEIGIGGPASVDDHGEITEEAPGIVPATFMTPMSDPGDLSAVGGSAMLPDDIGVGDDAGFGGPVDPGTDLGSTLLDDLAGDLSDPSDGFGGVSDGSGPPELDDQSGWAMDEVDENDRILAGKSAADFGEASETMIHEAIDAYEEGDDIWGDFLAEASAAAEDARQELVNAENLQSGSGPRDETMPAPDDGTGGDPDADDFIGGRGDVDPAPETEDHGGVGGLDMERAGFGAVDPAPETEDHGGVGGLDTVAAGLGAVDPLDGESTLLGGDTGDLAEMANAADLGDVEVEFDDSLVDADMGEDV